MRNDPECCSPSPRSRGCVLSLPLAHISHASRGSTYREAIGNLIAQAREQLILVAPFIDSAGISGLLTALLGAMLRGVNVIFLTHDALNIASFTSRAIEELRREAGTSADSSPSIRQRRGAAEIGKRTPSYTRNLLSATIRVFSSDQQI